jgi:hypothetical protein
MQPLVPTLLLCSLAGAQSASSATYFLAANDKAPGGAAQSATFVLAAGTGAPAGIAQSASFVLRAGFAAQLEVPVSGRPWLTGASPLFAKLRSAAPLTIHGTELHLGPLPVLTIAGQPAVILNRANGSITTNVPLLHAPGWQAIELQSSLGTTALTHGLGVLPLIELPVPAQSLVPFKLRYRGAQSDLVVWCFALGPLPFVLPLPPFWHGFELDLASLVALPPLGVTSPDGVLELGLPAVQLSVPVWVQAFGFGSDPGYAPGAFTNRLKL